MGAPLDIAGKRFNRLLVIRRVKVEGARNAMWECLCDCGNTTIAAASNLGKTNSSCGCLRMEACTEVLRGNTYRRTHNRSNTPEYHSWKAMKSRCHVPTNHKYPDYGGRGITVCDRWLNSFENFLEDMGEKPKGGRYTIDRIDNSGNYEPSNCRWALPTTQGRNTRVNRIVEIDGKRMCVIEWCEELGVPVWKPREMIRARGAKRNLPPAYRTIEEALTALYRGVA